MKCTPEIPIFILGQVPAVPCLDPLTKIGWFVGDTHYLYLLGEAMPDGASSWLDGSKNKTRSLRKTWLRLDEIENTPEITKQYRSPTRPTRASRAYRASRGSDSCHKSWTLSKSSHTADFQSACNSCTEIQREHQQLLEQYMSCMHH